MVGDVSRNVLWPLKNRLRSAACRQHLHRTVRLRAGIFQMPSLFTHPVRIFGTGPTRLCGPAGSASVPTFYASLVHENPCDVFFMETQEMEQPAGQASAVVPAAAGVGLVWAEQAVAGQPYRSALLGLLPPGRLAAWPLRRRCPPPDQ